MIPMNSVKLVFMVCLVHCTGCIWAEAVQPDKLKTHPDCESFIGDAEANSLLWRDQREGFEVA